MKNTKLDKQFNKKLGFPMHWSCINNIVTIMGPYMEDLILSTHLNTWNWSLQYSEAE